MQPSQNTNYDVTVVILAGGSSRRMHGNDKGLQLLHDRPLVAHVIERLKPQGKNLLLNCNDHCDEYRRFGYPLLQDTLPGKLGPLAGLLSAMETSESEYVLSVPCDTPYLPTDLVARLFETLQQSGTEVCTVDDGERLHPVIMLASRKLAAELRTYLEAGGRKVMDWYRQQKHSVVDYADQHHAFDNINTPEQLQAAESG